MELNQEQLKKAKSANQKLNVMKNEPPIEGAREISTTAQRAAYFKERIFHKLKDKFREKGGTWKKEITARALSFSRVNKDCLVIIGDTKRDLITIAYNGHFMTTDIKSKFFHLNQKIIRKVLQKEVHDEEKSKMVVREFINILNTLLINFINIINKPKPKVAENNNQK